jgi:hypothetical protein
MIATRRPSRAGSRQASASGGVLGLPSAIDPSLLDNGFDFYEFNTGFPDIDFDLDTLDWAGPNGVDMPSNDFNANDFQTHGNHLGLQLQYAPIESDAVQGQPDLVPMGALDPALEFQNPDFNFCDPNHQVPSQMLDTTPGFSALPGGTSSMPQLPATDQGSQMYPDPNGPMYHAAPYFYPQYPQQYTGYIPMPAEQYNAPQQINNSRRRSIHVEHTAPITQTSKRKRDRADSWSDDDAPLVKRPRQISPTKRSRPSVDSRCHSAISDNSSVSKPVKVLVVKAGEKPKKCAEKPWVRTNNITKGETTRTTRINQYTENGPDYKTKDLPYGDWSSTNFNFEYSLNFGMHEFKKRTMSARQIHEYITEYPAPGKLRLWIQPTASDAARRYASSTHSHCRFEKCPMRKWTHKGTIGVGDYRVAFDEKHKTYGLGVVSPYDCTGFVHLYCMERFLDFAHICEVADVRVDTRGDMPREPKGHFSGAFGSKNQAEAELAKKFVSAAKKGRLSETYEFSQYPVHDVSLRGEPKQHDRTLIHTLFMMNMEHRAPSQMKQFIVQRTVKPGSFPIHRGDMEIKLVDKKIESLEVFKDAVKSGNKATFDYSAYYDDFHPEIKQRQAEILARREQLLAEEGTAPKRSTKRKAAAVEDSDDEASASAPASAPQRSATKKRKTVSTEDSDAESDFEEIGNSRQHGSRSRSRPRNKQRIDYAEAQDLPALPGYQPAQNLDPRKASCSNLFPAADESWDSLEYSQDYIDQLINAGAAHRRKSSTLSRGPHFSALRSPMLQRAPRTASFNAQPVTSNKSFKRNDPPSHVHDQTRRSKRIASKASPPPTPDKIRSGRVDKRHHR